MCCSIRDCHIQDNICSLTTELTNMIATILALMVMGQSSPLTIKRRKQYYMLCSAKPTPSPQSFRNTLKFTYVFQITKGTFIFKIGPSVFLE